MPTFPTTFTITGLADRAAHANITMFAGDDVQLVFVPAASLRGMQLRFACTQLATITPSIVGVWPAQTVVTTIPDTATSSLRARALDWARSGGSTTARRRCSRTAR